MIADETSPVFGKVSGIIMFYGLSAYLPVSAPPCFALNSYGKSRPSATPKPASSSCPRPAALQRRSVSVDTNEMTLCGNAGSWASAVIDTPLHAAASPYGAVATHQLSALTSGTSDCLRKSGRFQWFCPSGLRSLVSGLWSPVSGLRSLVSSGGALPPGAHAHEMRKNRPNQVYQTVLGIKLSPHMVCALGESALPRVSGL